MQTYAFNHKDLVKMQMADRAQMNDMDFNAPDGMNSVLDGMQEQQDEYNKEQGIDEANELIKEEENTAINNDDERKWKSIPVCRRNRSIKQAWELHLK